MLSDQYLAMADKVTFSLSNKGLPVTSHNILSHLLSDITLLKVIEYTNEELVRQGQPITNLTEFKQFIGTRTRSTNNGPRRSGPQLSCAARCAAM